MALPSLRRNSPPVLAQEQCVAALTHAVVAKAHKAATADEERIARQKAAFVEQTWRLSRENHLKLQDAAHLVAARADQFPDLIGRGKHEASLLQEARAWHNYRSWAGKLGAGPGTRQPASDQWRRLLPRYRGSRPYEKPGDARYWTLLAALYEHPNKLSLRTAHLYAADMFRKAHGEDGVPTYDQADYYYERHADQKVVMSAREGAEWARNNLIGFVTRTVPSVDECWFSDHHIFDCAVRIWSEEKNAWIPVRPWVTAWMDWGSRYFHGIVIRAISPNRDSIERALRQGIRANGNVAPLVVYIDNGKDYRSSLNKQKRRLLDEADLQAMTSVADRLGCKTIFAIPFNARAKVIERIFGIVCGQFSKTWASYRGSNPFTRPETADASWNHPESLPTLEEFTARFMGWLDRYYHQRPGKGRILKGRSPVAVRQAAAPIRAALTDLDVYKAFLRDVPNRKRTILEGGVVMALNRSYSSEALYALLRQPGFKQVNVRVDPDDVAVAWIYTLDGKEIGQALQVQARDGLADPLDAKSIEGVREDIALQNRRLKALRQGSADNRGLTRYRRTPMDVDFGLGQLSEVTTPAPAAGSVARRQRVEPQPVYATADDVAALDEALREDTAANRSRLDSDYSLDNP